MVGRHRRAARAGRRRAWSGGIAFGPASFGPTTATALGVDGRRCRWSACSSRRRDRAARAPRPARATRRRDASPPGDGGPGGRRRGGRARAGRRAARRRRRAGVWPPAATATSWSLAPEGVPTISVSYWAFAGPGAAVDRRRAAVLAARRPCCCAGRRLVRRVLRPVGRCAGPTAAAADARGGAGRWRAPSCCSALALAFAVSTAVVQRHLPAQAEVDAQLTNGADVTVTGRPARGCGPDAAAALAAVPGVRAVEPMQHRFAYIGADLQDLYGVRPATITAVTALQDTYFQGGSAARAAGHLAARPTRSWSAPRPSRTTSSTRATRSTCGSGRRDPAADHGRRSTTPASSTSSPPPPRTASSSPTPATSPHRPAATRSAPSWSTPAGASHRRSPTASAPWWAPAATVTDIATPATRRIEPDRGRPRRPDPRRARLRPAPRGRGRRAGAVPRPDRAPPHASPSPPPWAPPPTSCAAWSTAEAVVLAVGGLAAGAGCRMGAVRVLVAVLTGVFDPPPAGITVPWLYLGAAAAATVGALALAAETALRRSRRPPIPVLRGAVTPNLGTRPRPGDRTP